MDFFDSICIIMSNDPLSQPIEQTIDKHPEIVSVLLKYQTKCVGCSMASFCTFCDAINIFLLPKDIIEKEIINAMNNSEELRLVFEEASLKG